MAKIASIAPREKEILSRKEVAEMLQINVRSVDKLEKEGELKAYRFKGLTGKKFYRYSQIEAILFKEGEPKPKARA